MHLLIGYESNRPSKDERERAFLKHSITEGFKVNACKEIPQENTKHKGKECHNMTGGTDFKERRIIRDVNRKCAMIKSRIHEENQHLWGAVLTGTQQEGRVAFTKGEPGKPSLSETFISPLQRPALVDRHTSCETLTHFSWTRVNPANKHTWRVFQNQP